MKKLSYSLLFFFLALPLAVLANSYFQICPTGANACLCAEKTLLAQALYWVEKNTLLYLFIGASSIASLFLLSKRSQSAQS